MLQISSPQIFAGADTARGSELVTTAVLGKRERAQGIAAQLVDASVARVEAALIDGAPLRLRMAKSP